MTHPINYSSDIDENRKLARDAIRSTEDSISRLEKLEVKYARLSMLTESLWTILRDKLQLPESTLKTALHDVLKNHEDLEHQKIDCPQCHKLNAAQKKACVYCGAVLNDSTPDSLFL